METEGRERNGKERELGREGERKEKSRAEKGKGGREIMVKGR